MRNIIILFALASIYFSGCSGQKIYTIEPDESEYDYFQGRKILTQEFDGLEVSVNYEYRDAGNHVYYIYAENASDNYVLLDPENIVSVQSGPEQQEYSIKPLNPEKEIELINRNKEDLDDAHEANVGFNCLFATVDVIADLADGDGEEAVESAAGWAEEMEYEQDSYEYESAVLNENRKLWENDALRITSLYPGEAAGGLVFIPIDDLSRKIKLVVNLGGNEFEFRFVQIVK